MRCLGPGVGGVLLVSVVCATAQTAPPSTSPVKLTAVDAEGRVQPVNRAPIAVETIGQDGAGATESPCPAVTAIPTDAAKALVLRVATEEAFYPDFVLSVAKIESRYSSIALSGKGAYGLMQLTPATARRFKVDLCDPQANARGGVRYLRVLHERYQNPFIILAAYNAGEEAVEKSRGVPPFPETVRFVADVMNDFYAWPDPAGARPLARSAAASTPDLIEPTGSDPAPQPSAGAKGPVAGWSDGFVMHVQ